MVEGDNMFWLDRGKYAVHWIVISWPKEPLIIA